MTSKEKKIFVAKAAAFVVFGAVLPIIFILWRYGIFENGPHSLGGVGLIVGLVAIICVGYVIREVRETLPYSYFTQILTGLIKVVLPLLAVYFALNAIKDSVDLLAQSVLATALCECVAVAVNPFPQWKHDHGKEEQDGAFLRFAKTFKETWNKED